MALWRVRGLAVFAFVGLAGSPAYGGFQAFAAVGYMDDTGSGEELSDGEPGDIFARVRGQGSFGGATSDSLASVDLGRDVDRLGSIKLFQRVSTSSVRVQSLGNTGHVEWQDVVRTGSTDLGTLRFGFLVEGTFAFEANSGWTTANFYLNDARQRYTFGGLTSSGGSFHNTVHETVYWDVPYIEQQYVLNLQGNSYAYVIQGWAMVDLANTVRLVSVTTLSGESVADRITFDSGFQLAPVAVPETASLALLVLGGSGLLAARRFRRA